MQICNFDFDKRYSYSLGDLESDALEAYHGNPTPPHRGAALTAATKRYKGSEMLHFIHQMHGKEDLDMTPVLAKRLLQGLFGRSVLFDTLVSVYGDKNRSASNKSSDFKRLDELVERYKPEAKVLAQKMTQDAREAIKRAQEEYKKSQQDPTDD
ncbi:hypothetical protein FT122_23455 [Vibrio alginolyticus]|nr:hypothetical protein [Vibrio alginolyticus]